MPPMLAPSLNFARFFSGAFKRLHGLARCPGQAGESVRLLPKVGARQPFLLSRSFSLPNCSGNNEEANSPKLPKQQKKGRTNILLWPAVKAALMTYREKEGDLLVKRRFVVPDGDPSWPVETWGLRLGTIVAKIRKGDYYAAHSKELIDLGFDFSFQGPRPHGWAKIYRALKAYKEKFGNLSIPMKFVVAADDLSWPEELRGLKLGDVAHNIRNHAAYEEHRTALELMGFDMSRQSCRPDTSARWNRQKLAFQKYKEIYGDLNIPYAFVVPFNGVGDGRIDSIRAGKKSSSAGTSSSAPTTTTGAVGGDIKLTDAPVVADTVNVTRSTLSSDSSLSSTVAIKKPQNDDESVNKAAATATAGQRRVRPVIWPLPTHGLKLGLAIRNIKHKNYFSEFRDEILELGIEIKKEKENKEEEDADDDEIGTA